MTKKSKIGQIGENIACKYLMDNGYGIIKRNFRKPWGEIDVITKAPDKTLVFIEVKTMSDYAGAELRPEDQLTATKLKKLQRTAQFYAGHYPEQVDDNKNWQIDLIAILLNPNTNASKIKHYQNI